jgi:hypothetical protein
MRSYVLLLAAPLITGTSVHAQSPSGVKACSSLEGMQIASTEIGLPTTGALVEAASSVPAAEQRVEDNQVILATPEYCKVTGHISPVDPAAPPINFQVNLPGNWNHKAAQMGGSGLNGSIPISLTSAMRWGPESIPPDAPYALSRGFAVYGSDSGHQAGSGPARGVATGPPEPDWTLNPEALTNFAYAQMKKTHDVARDLIRRYYGELPRRTYYLGSSQGGREALMVVQRFPQDYDGVFVQVPVFPQMYWLVLDPLIRTQQQAGAGWIPPAKVGVIAKEVLRQCDALDGIADGLVSNYLACDRKFDPALTPNAWSAVRCPEGADTGSECLSDPQIKSAEAFYGRVKLPFPLYKGWDSYPGWTTGGESPTNWKAFNSKPSDSSNVPWIKTLIANDPSVTPLTFNLDKYRDKVQQLSALLDAQDPDLSAFRNHGGKLLWKVNTADYTANPRWSFDYYNKIVSTMGQPAVDSFLRFYVAIGIAHNRNVGKNPLTNEPVPAFIDFIGLLDDWVEKGKVPADRQVLVDMPTVPPFTERASFPMCRYPQYPKYAGKGDPKQASSYDCVK